MIKSKLNLLGIIISILIINMSILSADTCEDDATDAYALINATCDLVINTFGQPCDANFSGINIWEECPIACDACPPEEDGCDLPSKSFGITDDGWL